MTAIVIMAECTIVLADQGIDVHCLFTKRLSVTKLSSEITCQRLTECSSCHQGKSKEL